MKNTRPYCRVPLVATLMFLSCSVFGQALVQPKAAGIESPGYVWNRVQSEELLALRATGRAERGLEAYRVCHGCHKAGGVGTVDGVYPRLAGQHDTVLIKQLVDVRSGRRDNPAMYPFASEHGISTQDIADLAAYLTKLPVSPDNGVGDGKQLARGQKLYVKDCVVCHGVKGEGTGEKFYPRVAGQHYRYLRSEILSIQNGQRRNANPEMVKAIHAYSASDAEAVADYMSRLPMVSRP